MKNYQSHLPFCLLVSYIIYSGFVPINIAHSIVLCSLAALCGYHSYLSRQENTKYNKEVLEQLKDEFEVKYSQLKEAHERKLNKIEDELAKVQLNSFSPKPSSSPSAPIPRKAVF